MDEVAAVVERRACFRARSSSFFLCRASAASRADASAAAALRAAASRSA